MLGLVRGVGAVVGVAVGVPVVGAGVLVGAVVAPGAGCGAPGNPGGKLVGNPGGNWMLDGKAVGIWMPLGSGKGN